MTTAEGTKTAIIVKKETAAAVGTADMAKERTAAAIETAATTRTAVAMKTAITVSKALKIFRKGVIIATREKTAIVATRIPRRGSATSFNMGEKYI